MKRLAILGSDSTHTEVYGELARTGQFKGRVAVQSIWGENSEATAEKAAKLGIASVAGSPQEAVSGADGVLVLARFANDRARLAAVALDAGLPVFIDKCISEDPGEAEAIIERATRRGIALMSCSPYRFAAAVVHGRSLARNGSVSCGFMMGPRECNDLGPDPRFKGVGFYGIHSAESVVEVYGNGLDVICCRATSRGTLMALRAGDGGFCSIALLSDLLGETYRLTLMGAQGVEDLQFSYDADSVYPQSFEAILGQLFEGDERVPPSSNLASIRLVAAMEAAA